MKNLMTKLLAATFSLIIVACGSTSTISQSNNTANDSAYENTQKSRHVKYLDFITSIEEEINDRTISETFINDRSLNKYVIERDIFSDSSIISAVDIPDLLISKIISTTYESDVWYVDSVFSLSNNYTIARFLVYYDDGNMSSLELYLDKKNNSILDVLVGEETFTMTDKVANVFLEYEQPVYNSISGNTINRMAPNVKAPILKPYYPNEQRQLVKVLTNLQDATQASQAVDIYKNLDEKFKTLHMLEFIEVRALVEEWDTVWLYGELLKLTDVNTQAYSFFSFYFYNVDDYDAFFVASAMQSTSYKQSIAWQFYQLISARFYENDELINESAYQLLTRFGDFDFIYYLVATQYIRMNKLQEARMIEIAMEDRFEYRISKEDLDSISNGVAYYNLYRN